MTTPPHPRASDLPGWPCPPRVRDIAKTKNSWGWVAVWPHGALVAGVVQDEIGKLWVNGDFVPRFRYPNESDANPGAIAFWTVHGIGIYIHPWSYPHLDSLNSWAMEPDQWVPVGSVAASLPDFVTETFPKGKGSDD